MRVCVSAEDIQVPRPDSRPRIVLRNIAGYRACSGQFQLKIGYREDLLDLIGNISGRSLGGCKLRNDDRIPLLYRLLFVSVC